MGQGTIEDFPPYFYVIAFNLLSMTVQAIHMLFSRGPAIGTKLLWLLLHLVVNIAAWVALIYITSATDLVFWDWIIYVPVVIPVLIVYALFRSRIKKNENARVIMMS